MYPNRIIFENSFLIIHIIEMTLPTKKILGRTSALHLFHDVSKIQEKMVSVISLEL